MPKREYYSSKDIQEILGVGKRKAYEILHMFDYHGKLFRDGKTMRVRIDYFNEWLDHKDGETRRAQIIEGMFSLPTCARDKTA